MAAGTRYINSAMVAAAKHGGKSRRWSAIPHARRMLAALMSGTGADQQRNSRALAHISRADRKRPPQQAGHGAAARGQPENAATVTTGIASPLVARMLESHQGSRRHRDAGNAYQPALGHRTTALRFARSCYDHLAGQAWRRHRRTPWVAKRFIVLTDEGRRGHAGRCAVF